MNCYCVLLSLLELLSLLPAGGECAKHTPLQLAVMGGQARVTNRLLDAKADPQVVAADGRQLIHIAALAPCEDLIEMLVKRGGQQMGALSPHGWSPIFLAVGHTHLPPSPIRYSPIRYSPIRYSPIRYSPICYSRHT